MNLDAYGIQDGINELIVTTSSSKGTFNAAPMGIIRRDGKLMVRVYNESQTCTNIKETGVLAANMVYDPVVFVQSALGDLADDMFVGIDLEGHPGFPVLARACAWVFFSAEYRMGSKAIVAELIPMAGDMRAPGIRPINRGFNAVIEATILATRYHVFNEETYLRQIKSYKEVINTCGGSREIEAYALLLSML